MANIGIVGAGVAGLQLGLYLQQRGISATIYAERSAAQQLGGQLPSLVARHHHTRERERMLGVNHWDGAISASMRRMHVSVAGEQPLRFYGDLENPGIVVDMRIYCARLLEDFAARGGQVVVGGLEPADVERLSLEHDLMVVSTGRGGLGAMFPRMAEHSPYTTPPRHILTGLFRGIAYNLPIGADFMIVPGYGELFALPIYSFEPGLTGIGLEAIPGSPFEAIARDNYTGDPRRLEKTLLELFSAYIPSMAARIDRETFRLTRPLDLMQGSITPVVRRAYTQLPNGRFAVALGDAHILNDPILGQGANNASYAAWQLGMAISGAAAFDERFCRSFEDAVWAYVGPVTAWNNAMLQPPPAHMIEFLVAATQHQSLGHSFVNFLADPLAGWHTFSNPANTSAMLAKHGWQGMPIAAD